MKQEDRAEVIEMMRESAKIISEQLNDVLNKQSNRFNDALDKQANRFNETIKIAIAEVKNEMIATMIATMKEVMDQQTDRFVKALKPYEIMTEKHDKTFKKMKDALDDENEKLY